MIRRYSVHVEDVVSGADVKVGATFTRWGMLRRVRRGNSRVVGVPVRFFGKVSGRWPAPDERVV